MDIKSLKLLKIQYNLTIDELDKLLFGRMSEEEKKKILEKHKEETNKLNQKKEELKKDEPIPEPPKPKIVVGLCHPLHSIICLSFLVAALLREVLSGHLRMVHRAIPLFGHRVGEIHFLFDTLTDKFRFKIGQNT